MREFLRDGIRWTVRKVDSSRQPGSRRPTCLIIECDGVVRRVWDFPASWRELSDDEIWSLLDQAPLVGCAAVARALDAAREVTERTRSLLIEVRRWRTATSALRAERAELLDRCNAMRAEMRKSITTYAVSLRGEGVPPERAIVLLKHAVQDAITESGDPTFDSDRVLHDGIDWAIDAYYAA
jgi:hypothetical protein